MTTVSKIDDEAFLIPSYFPDSSNNSILTNRNITGHDAYTLALEANYLACHGNQKICTSTIGGAFAGGGGFQGHYRIMDYINPNITEQMLILNISSSATQADAVALFTSSLYNSNYAFISMSLNPSSEGNIIGVMPLNTSGITVQSGQTHSIDFIMSSSTVFTSNGLQIESLSLVDVPPRYRNPTSSSFQDAIVCNVQSCFDNQPLFAAPDHQNTSYSGIAKVAIEYSGSLSYKNLYTALSPYQNLLGYVFSDLSASQMYAVTNSKVNFTNNVNVCQPIVYATPNSTTQRSKKCIVWAWGAVENSFNTGRIELTSSIGTSYIDFTSTTPSWKSTTIDIECVNPDNYAEGTMPQFINNFTGNLNINLWKPVSSVGFSAFRVWSLQIFETL